MAVKGIQQGKDILFNKWYWDNWVSMCKKMNLDPYHIPYTTINSTQTRDLNATAKTIKLLEENTAGNFCGLWLDKGVSDMTPKV